MTKLVNLILVFVLLCGFNSIVSRPKTWVPLNFQKFTEDDPAGDIAINSPTKVTVTTMARNVDASLQKDFGPEYFYGDWEFQFEVTITAIGGTASNVPTALPFSVSNIFEATTADDTPGPLEYFRVFADGSDSYQIDIYGGASVPGVAQNVKVYCTAKRINKTLTGYVYSDPGRKNLMGSTSVTAARPSYRYVSAVGSRNGSGTETISFIVENMRFRFL